MCREPAIFRSPGKQSHQYAQHLLQSALKEAFEQKGKVYEMEEESMVAEGKEVSDNTQEVKILSFT